MTTWNWPPWVKLPFTAGMVSMALESALAGSLSTKRSRVRQWLTVAMFSLPPILSISWARCCALILDMSLPSVTLLSLVCITL
ncbi:hypothetical protein D3C78_1127710 [compost metagenome]